MGTQWEFTCDISWSLSTLFAEPAGRTCTVAIYELNDRLSLHFFDAWSPSSSPALSASKSAIILFASRPSLSSTFKAKGYRVDVFDTKINGEAHHILVPTVLHDILQRIQKKEYQMVWISPPTPLSPFSGWILIAQSYVLDPLHLVVNIFQRGGGPIFVIITSWQRYLSS